MNEQPTPPYQQGYNPSPSPEQSFSEQVSDRVKLVIEAAERAAGGIIDDAEGQARKYLDASRARAEQIAAQRGREMSALADELVGYAETLKRQSEQLLSALDETKRRIDQTLAVETPPDERPPSVGPAFSANQGAQQAPPGQAAPAPVHHLTPVGRQAVSEASSQAGSFGSQGRGAGSSSSEQARLLATQMAVAGSSRAEIESRLQNELGIEGPGPMLDAILGREE